MNTKKQNDLKNINVPFLKGVKIGIVVSEWNSDITNNLYIRVLNMNQPTYQ